MAELIKKLWAMSWDLWMHRNTKLHTSAKARLQILKADVNRWVEEEFQQGGQGLPRDALPMMQTLAEQVLQWPLATRQQWLDSLAAARHRQE